MGADGAGGDASGTPSSSVSPSALKPITTEQLAEILARTSAATTDERDELLTDLLVRPYPTKLGQDN